MLDASILQALNDSCYSGELSSIMNYAVFPAGKLFRPRLVMALSRDIDCSSNEITNLASALEIHHAYTLVHDDLPAMDNDSIRRGKASTHAQYGEWKAILAGDALLISSFHEVQKIKNESVRKLFCWATGAKGLILGQFLDLNSQGNLSINEIIRIHELKTSRLLQIATLGTYLLSTESPRLSEVIRFFRLGRDIGVAFQLIDDLKDLAIQELNQHEKLVNPYLINPEKTFQEFKLTYSRIKLFLSSGEFQELSMMLETYFSDSKSLLKSELSLIQGHFESTFWINDLQEWINN